MVILIMIIGRSTKKKSDIPEIFKQTQKPTHLNIQGKGITIEHENWSD